TPSPAGATASNNTATTGTTGAATFSGLTLSGTAGNYTLSFGGTGLTPVSSGPIALSAGTAASIAPNGGGTSATAGTAVTPPPSVIVRDASGNLVSGVAVTFAPSSGGSVTGSNPTTGTDGIATVGSWTLAPTAGTNTLTATATGSGISGNPVTFTATGTVGPVSATTSTVGAAPPSIPAGSCPSTIRVTARDAGGNTIGGASVFLTATGVTGGGGTPNPVTPSGNASGIATTSWTLGVLPGQNTLTATATGLTGSPVTFTATATVGSPSSTQSRVNAQPATVPASTGSSASTLTVTALDAAGNPVPGATVALDASGAGNTLTQQAATTDASGKVTGTLSSTKAETKTVSAILNGTLAVAQTPTVVVLPGAATALGFTVQPSNTMIRDRITPPVRVTAFDAFGNMADS